MAIQNLPQLKKQLRLIEESHLIYKPFGEYGRYRFPKEVVKILPEIINKQMDKEAVIIEAARSPGFNINKLLAAMNNAEEIH